MAFALNTNLAVFTDAFGHIHWTHRLPVVYHILAKMNAYTVLRNKRGKVNIVISRVPITAVHYKPYKTHLRTQIQLATKKLHSPFVPSCVRCASCLEWIAGHCLNAELTLSICLHLLQIILLIIYRYNIEFQILNFIACGIYSVPLYKFIKTIKFLLSLRFSL